MGNILSYNRRTNELVARNNKPAKIVKYIYKFTLYSVNFTSDYVYYLSDNWSIESVDNGNVNGLKDVTFTYTGPGGEVGNKYYTLNLAPYQAVKIVQFSRLADLTNNDPHLNYTTRFSWVSKQALDTITSNDDEFDALQGDVVSRDYSIQFIGPSDFITTPLVEYKQNLGEIYIENTNADIISLHQVCIRNVNPIGTAAFYSKQIRFDYINPAWSLTTFTSQYDSTKIDYCFTYNGAGGKYLFSSGSRFMLIKFSQTIDQESSNINHDSEILTLEEPLTTGTIRDKTIMNKIYVNTVFKDNQPEIDYRITPLRYFKSQALFDYDNSSWSIQKYNFYSHGLRRIEIKGINLSHEGLLINNGILNFPDWSISTTVYENDATLNNVIVQYTGNDPNHGYTSSDLFIFTKLFNRLLHNKLSNIVDTTMVNLSIVASTTFEEPYNYIHYNTSGYLIDVSFAETIEYIGCNKLLTYNPVSGLLRFNGVTDTIPSISQISLLNVNLVTTSAYSGTVTDWDLSDDDNSVFGTYKDLIIDYKEVSPYVVAQDKKDYICKFYKVSDETAKSQLNVNTMIRIPLSGISNSGVTSGYVYIDLLEIAGGAEYWSSLGTGYIEYTANQAMFSVEPSPSVPIEEVLHTIKKFVVQNVNASSFWVHQPTVLTGWTITEVSNENNPVNNDVSVEYSSGNNDVFNLTNTIDIFLFTRTAILASPTNITENSDVKIYLNYNNEDEEENYFSQGLSSDNETEYIDGTPVIEYSKYFGTFRLLNNGNLVSIESVKFFDVNVDDNTSIYDTFPISGSLVVSSMPNSTGSQSADFDTMFTWSSLLQIPSVNGGTEFVRFNRLGAGVTMDDMSDSNISDTSVIHFKGKDSSLLDVDIYLSLVSISDEEQYEYYSKRNYIEYYAEIGELRLRRSIIDTLYAVELVGISIQASDLHFINPNWTASSSVTSGPGGGGTGAYDLKLTHKEGAYSFPIGNVDDELKLCTFYQLLSNIDTTLTQVRLYVQDVNTAAEVENTADKSGAESFITDNAINYYMTTGSLKLEATNPVFTQLYKFVLYGVNVNEHCIFSRTFSQLGGWFIRSEPNFYNDTYVDFYFEYNGSMSYPIAGEVFMFQFFDTVTRTIENASIINSIASGMTKETPVTWYDNNSSIGITGYFIKDKDTDNGYVHPNNEYYSENARIFKYYNNLGLTEIVAGASSRISSVTSISFLDVNYSINQIFPDRTSTDINISSVNSEEYQDFTIDFGAPYNVTATGTNKDLITVYDFYKNTFVDYLMNNNTIALLTYGSITIPIRTLSGENPEYYKMNGLLHYDNDNGDIDFMQKSYGGTTTTEAYKIVMEKVNASIGEIILVYGSWTVESRRVGSLFTVTFEYNGMNNTNPSDIIDPVDGFTNIVLLLGYYAPVYGSSLIDQTTVVTITFNSAELGDRDKIAQGKLLRRVKNISGNVLTFDDRLTYPIPTNLYSSYKDYKFLFLSGDARKTGVNTFISVFDRLLLTGNSGKTKEFVFEDNATKLQFVRYTVLKSKTSPYDFVCEESGYVNISLDSNKPDLGNIKAHIIPEKNIQERSVAVTEMNNTLGNGNHTLYEILNSILVVTIPKYDGTTISREVRDLLLDCGTDFDNFKLEVGHCYMCVLFVTQKFEIHSDLASYTDTNRQGFVLSKRRTTAVIYENSSRRKLAASVPYAQVSSYMKYDYMPVLRAGNSGLLPNVMLLNAKRTLNKYRNNSIVYKADVL